MKTVKLESKYQADLKKRLEIDFPGCVVLKNDPVGKQGIPDLLVLYKNKWAMLEVKRSEDSSIRPNQKYWVDKLNSMGFAMFINPQNEEFVFDLLHKHFGGAL